MPRLMSRRPSRAICRPDSGAQTGCPHVCTPVSLSDINHIFAITGGVFIRNRDFGPDSVLPKIATPMLFNTLRELFHDRRSSAWAHEGDWQRD